MDSFEDDFGSYSDYKCLAETYVTLLEAVSLWKRPPEVQKEKENFVIEEKKSRKKVKKNAERSWFAVSAAAGANKRAAFWEVALVQLSKLLRLVVWIKLNDDDEKLLRER